jgi:hypothetical protein
MLNIIMVKKNLIKGIKKKPSQLNIHTSYRTPI